MNHPPKPGLGRCAGVVLALFLLRGEGVSQEPASRPASRPVRLDAAITHFENRTWYLIEGVRIVYGDLDIRCDSAVVWLAKEKSSVLGEAPEAPETRGAVKLGQGMQLGEIYAEGHVLLRQGEEVHYCESAFFDLVHERGIIVESRTRFPITPANGEQATLTLKAEELRILSQFQLEAVDVQISTCPYGNPHYHVASDKVQIYRARARAAAQSQTPSDPETIPTFYYTATGNLLYTGSGFPTLWVPDLAGDSGSPVGQTVRYVKGANLGRSNQFGTEIGLQLGDAIRDERGKPWGSWLLDLAYLSKRGAGVGVDFSYEKPDHRGEIKAYYQRDVGEDQFFGKPPTENRGRVSIQHRTKIFKDFQLDLEANLFSDRGYFFTYFEDEFKQDKPPETYAYLKRAFENSAVTGLYSVRLNDWETVNEFRPRLEYLLISEPLACVFENPLYFTARAELSRPRAVFDEDLDLPNISNVRADLDTLVEYPFMAGPVRVIPFLGLRTTYYEHDLFRNDDRVRTGFTYGAELSSRLSRTFDVCGGLFALDGLRHIVEPSLEYRKTTGVELHPDELFFYDEVDAFDDVETLTFELRNVFQTVRHRKDQPATVEDVFDLDLEMTFFPDAAADNDGDSWGNLRGEAALRIAGDFQAVTNFEWSPNGAGLEMFDIGLGYLPSREFQAYAGLRHYDEIYDVVYGQVNWRVSEKWLARAYSSYDVERGEGVEHDLVLSRVGHDWVFSLLLGADVGEDDYSVSIALEPRILFDPVLRPTGRRRDPEFQYSGTWVDK